MCRRRSRVAAAAASSRDLFHSAAGATAPLWRRLPQVIAEDELVRADETPMRVLAKGQTRRGYLWTFWTDKLVGFCFSPTRSRDTPARVLGGSRGYLVVDGYTGYNSVLVPDGRVRVGCWAHVRRKYWEAKSSAPEAERVVDLIGELYRIEETARNARISGTGEHMAVRWRMAGPVLRKLETWMKEELPRHPPKSPLAEAIRYTHHWTALTRFLESADLPLDNNASERALPAAALGRKNYLFVGHDEAGENIAGLYSLVSTCEANGVNPQAYLADVLPRPGSHPQSGLDELLPHRWAPSDMS